jgi:hypothetical protein
MKYFGLALSLAALACSASAARASISYQYVASQTNLSLANGQSQTVNIYLQETLTGSSTSYIYQQAGLLGAGYQIQLQSGTATISSQTTATGTGATFGTGGNSSTTGPVTVGGLQTWKVSETTNGSVGALGGITQTGGGLILLGTETFTGGTTASVFTLGARSGNNTLTFNGNVNLDVSQTGSGTDSQNNPIPAFTGAGGGLTFTINVAPPAVPEPSSILLCGFAAGGMGFGAWRRRQAKREAASAQAIA